MKYYSKGFALAYGKRLEKGINDQLLRAANLVADFWYTAWVDAGKPDLQDLLPEKFTAGDKEEMKKEDKIYRHNEV